MTRRAKRGRLTRSADFERVYRQGRSHGNRYFVLYAFPRTAQGEGRMGVSVSRKVGGAVQRNRLKRLLREAVTTADRRIPDGVDVVVIARPDARELAEREGLRGIEEALGELIEKAAAGTAP